MMPKPLNIAHRGARAYAPENTIEAFAKALALGADGIELDIQTTSDKKLVVLHDTKLFDGSLICEQTFDEIKTKIKQKYRYEICCFSEVFDLFGERCYWDIELKDIQSGPMISQYLQSHERNNILLSSFLPQALELVQQHNSKIPIAPIFDRPCSDPLQELGRFNSNTIINAFNGITKQYVQLLHAHNKKIFLWTVNKPKDMQQFIDWGVDGIITDYPDRLVELLQN